MTQKQDLAKLAEVKRTLAKKYESLARTVKSKPRRTTWNRLAGKFRRQAEEAARKGS
jgi:hypothetical protein